MYLRVPADEFWQQQFGMLSEVTWNQFWKQFEGSFVPYLPMEKPLPQELLKQNISSASSKVITSKDFLQAAGSQPLHSFFTQCMNGDIQWSRTVGGQGHAWTDRVVASQGEYITEWQVGIKTFSAQSGSDSFRIRCLVSLQGKCSNGDWLPELKSQMSPECSRQIVSATGFSKLKGRSGGWVTNFLGVGDDKDSSWTLEADPKVKGPCRVAGYQLRTEGDIVGGARFLFAGPGWLGTKTGSDCQENLQASLELQEEAVSSPLAGQLLLVTPSSSKVKVTGDGVTGSHAITARLTGQSNSPIGSINANSSLSAEISWCDNQCCLKVFNFNNAVDSADGHDRQLILKSAHLRVDCTKASGSQQQGSPVQCSMKASHSSEVNPNIMILNSALPGFHALQEAGSWDLVQYSQGDAGLAFTATLAAGSGPVQGLQPVTIDRSATCSDIVGTEVCHVSSQTAHHGSGSAMSLLRHLDAFAVAHDITTCQKLNMSNDHCVTVVTPDLRPEPHATFIFRCTVSLDFLVFKEPLDNAMDLNTQTSVSVTHKFSSREDISQASCEYDSMDFIDIAAPKPVL